ncbi:hypothetical protein NQ318_010854 [Aromia moschata]|uniref:RNase H type-1 domain-containing protein n=1 Tax=Aromia moschata TaxID=1265417 RepID=A0AAV8YIB6_9CUCU|nr:hypothetical protein NQ318_010854 [Aromia moschata]
MEPSGTQMTPKRNKALERVQQTECERNNCNIRLCVGDDQEVLSRSQTLRYSKRLLRVVSERLLREPSSFVNCFGRLSVKLREAKNHECTTTNVPDTSLGFVKAFSLAHVWDRLYTNKRIQIICDSQAALKAPGAVEIHSQAVKDYMDSLTQLAEHNSITLKWMRGHQGHEGNERTDFLAKKGAEVPLIGPEPTCGLAYRTARRAIKDLLREKHISHWVRHSRINQLRWIVGLFTGHCPRVRHLTTIVVKINPDCRRCGEEEETSFHILCECPALSAIRHSNFGAITTEPKEVTDAPLETVLKFLKETGLME